MNKLSLFGTPKGKTRDNKSPEYYVNKYFLKQSDLHKFQQKLSRRIIHQKVKMFRKTHFGLPIFTKFKDNPCKVFLRKEVDQNLLILDFMLSS